MSTTSARRVRERGSGGEKIAAAAAAAKTTPLSGKSAPTGKENPRPTSRLRAATQKPSIPPMARIDKSAGVRKSTSSVPRGRSSSPSDFTRVFSELRKESRVSMGPSQIKVSTSRSNEKTDARSSRVSKDIVKTRVALDKLDRNSESNEKIGAKFMQNGGVRKKIGSLSSISVKNTVLENKVSSNSKESNRVDGNRVKASEERKSKMVRNASTSLRENGVNKYPSKLHEKLAFLEGKVKRIASDIKRTKEILDISNPDSSTIILCDIQENISGIEKAMGTDVGSAKCENEEKSLEENTMDAKCSIKGLNDEELEARLFPHHKLIRDRSLSKTAYEESKNAMNLEIVAFSSNKETNVGEEVTSVAGSSLNAPNAKCDLESLLFADENLNEFDDYQEKVPAVMLETDEEDNCTYQLNVIGSKSSTGGWFVSEGESVLLAHGDGSCSFYDITNSEEKAEYKPPGVVSPNIWRDCWIIRAPSADGCSGKYVVAASAGNNSVESGFCSWDFYTKDVKAFNFEDATNARVRRTAFASLSNNTMHHGKNPLRWYTPCGPLITSTASCQRSVHIYDIRDGERVMKWELQKPVSAMDCSSPLQWRNRGKVVVAEVDGVSVWDVNSLTSKALLSVSSSGQKISALHVNNTDAELGGGVRQRVSSSEAEGNDGVFCTPDSINVLDFRQPSGIGLKIPKHNINAQSVFSRGDSIYIGCNNYSSSSLKNQSSSQIHHFSLRKQSLLATYSLPESDARNKSTSVTQVWGNSDLVMGVCGIGLFVFDSLKNEAIEAIGLDDVCSPSFDYLDSRVLIVSRDGPACWRYLL
ncbi:hypothetical protein ABFS82_07G049300 [Erythranthe guttata]|uniref:At4g14310 8-bladed propeller domain-containing protein n=1 Tax=Erythranthe guttata TaxID=4155 RepID=A0A022PVM7_ERYGU|nr:PREDICTED: uncharacterized protein LOC105949846 [Erythranthe guttata]EYU18305.1 hypothetical protein MIMGU_mgv1a022398mg [Erythranthe guttata]|eukprot:XP_012828610.1 PREDICTED: uncharacterized protein LOC105949846 [Erythranthe guttata]